MDPAVALLCDLVAIDSVNPSLVPGGAGEAAVADRIAAALRGAGIDVEQTEVAPGRPNVVGVVEGRAPGRALILCGHTDTVGVESMAAPFDPVVRGGRLYGRGSQDMKSGVAAMVDAALRVARNGGLSRGRLVVAAVSDEEHASAGAEVLVREYSADGAVVTEPTDLRVATAHKGFEWVEIETRGRAAHGSRPEDGRDAILHMGRVLGRLEAVEARLKVGRTHPRLGRASLHASTIDGGQALSVYPDRCVLGVERRTLVGEPSDAGLMEVQRVLSALAREDGNFDASVRQFVDAPHPMRLPTTIRSARSCGRFSGGRVSTTRRPACPSGRTPRSSGARGRRPCCSVRPAPVSTVRTSTSRFDSVSICRDTLVELIRAFC